MKSIGARVYEHIREHGPQTMGDLVDFIYGDDAPSSASASIRTRVARHNRTVLSGEKVVAVGWYRSFTWQIVKGDERVRIKPEPRIFTRGDITNVHNLVGPPARFPVRTDRFHAGSLPRYGR